MLSAKLFLIKEVVMKKKVSSESVVKDIGRRTLTKYSSEEKNTHCNIFVVNRA